MSFISKYLLKLKYFENFYWIKSDLSHVSHLLNRPGFTELGQNLSDNNFKFHYVILNLELFGLTTQNTKLGGIFIYI